MIKKKRELCADLCSSSLDHRFIEAIPTQLTILIIIAHVGRLHVELVLHFALNSQFSCDILQGGSPRACINHCDQTWTYSMKIACKQQI